MFKIKEGFDPYFDMSNDEIKMWIKNYQVQADIQYTLFQHEKSNYYKELVKLGKVYLEKNTPNNHSEIDPFGEENWKE